MMARFAQYACLLLLALPHLQVTAIEPVTTLAAISAIIGIVTGAITFAKQASENIDASTRYLGDEPENDDGYKRPYNPMHSSLMDQLRFLSRRSDLLKADIEDMRDQIINQITEQVPGLVELNNRLSTIFLHSKSISKSYDDFLEYFDQPEKFDKNKVMQFANKMISEDTTGITKLLEDIHTRLVLRDALTPSAVTLLVNHMQLFLRNARLLKSPQQLLHDLLRSVMITEIKGLLTMKYSYRLLDLYKQGNFVGHVEKTEHDFGKRINVTIDTFQNAMTAISQEIWKNNPTEHVEDVTYTQLKNVFQEYIINEYDISPSDKCQNTCSDYRIPQEKTPRRCYYRGEICEITECDGYLYDCQYKVDTKMNVCPSGMNTHRRYEFIDYGNGLRHGSTKGKCHSDTLVSERHFSTFWWCDPCMCVCADTSKKSERRFNLDPVMANIEENYVITGARFVKRNRMIHIQIQEGQLLPTGQINTSTLSWSKINENPWNYYTLDWEEGREISLDDIKLPKNYVLTGLSFTAELSDYTKYTRRLHLKSFGAPLYFYSGELELKHRMEFKNGINNDEIKMKNLDIPTRKAIQTVNRSKANQFVKFGPTGLEKDVGQNTIPFIDTQEITTNPPVPLSGAGIYHKSRTGDGGFLALKLFTYNFAQHLKADLPDNFTTLDSVKEF